MRLVVVSLLLDYLIPHGPIASKGSKWNALRIHKNFFDPYPIKNFFDPYPIKIDEGEVFGYLVFFNHAVLFVPVDDADED